eukprot:gnl/MRDRNA2_/MRDRNA2_34349_c0_seq1.p1 gnl/MRDRNA2_/MRDRNA2_34349_c0~~gnl/MRDRNA2_/MRDRNA2_34349_c0_seq1.p1  ORF type:complete len:466 (+),score=47.08 gnl/MRDRNA2_/MRDRNA2_34349_c0_seq1:88-1485(+)
MCDAAQNKFEVRKCVLAACVVMFAEGFCATMSFPFGSFMVEHLRGGDEHLGLMTGLFFAAYSVGSLLTARMWGSMANHIGRRACLLTSLGFSTLLTLAIAVCPSYELVVLLRFANGMLSCSLPMTRTGLHEVMHQLKGDDIWAFSLLQAAFAASSVLGPAVGGFIYGSPSSSGFVLPWTSPYSLACCLFILAWVVSYAFTVETVDLHVPRSLRSKQSNEVVLFSSISIMCFLVMAAGHSYVFTGWEVGYPLLARNRALEAWCSARIGVTFLIGSVCLLFHTLFTYRPMVKRMGLHSVWKWSWILCILALAMFPRVLKALLALGYDTASWPVIAANYVTQVFISVFQGCNFTTLQLMLNRLISARDDSEYALPLANAWMVSLQGLARATSPVMTGSFAAYPSPFEGVMAFDALAGVAAVCCVMFGCILQNASDDTGKLLAVEPSAGHAHGKVDIEDGYKPLQAAEH